MTPETENHMRQLEEQILSSEIPEDRNDSREDTLSKVTKNIKKSISNPPKKSSIIMITVITITLIISIVLLSSILSILSKPSQTPVETGADINGFNALVEEESLTTPSDLNQTEYNYTSNNTQQNENTDLSETTIPVTTEDSSIQESEAINKYYASPSIQSANPEDSLIQIAENIYKIPVSLKDLEADGIHLITLGSKPPSEDALLSPGKRDGYIQCGDERYRVKVYNGQESTYHDLTVIGITVENVESASVYLFGGITIGTQEASIPASAATKIEIDYAKTHTFYYYGTLTENSIFNKSGKCISIITSTKTGQVDKLEVYNDATMN